MKRKYIVLLIMLMLGLMMVSGCGRSLSGTYANGHSSFTFSSDGTFVNKESTGRFDGKYTIDGNVITLEVYGFTDIMKFTGNPNELDYHGVIYTKEKE